MIEMSILHLKWTFVETAENDGFRPFMTVATHFWGGWAAWVRFGAQSI